MTRAFPRCTLCGRLPAKGSIALNSFVLRSRRGWPLVAAGLLLLVSLGLFWPGVVTFDGVAQYAQVLSGVYDDWHPPIEARLWSALHPLGPGAGPMLVVQLGGYWLGFGLIAAALARVGRKAAAIGVLGIALFPPFLGWQGVVLKDAQMAGAMLAAVGLVGWWRLDGRPVPRVAWAAVVVLIGYATLVRANAVFATMPLVVMLARWPVGWLSKAAATAIGVVAVLTVAPSINHGAMGALRTGVERSQAIYDLAGIAAREPDAGGTGLTEAERAEIVARRCAIPFFWDPLGDADHCNATVDRLRGVPVGTLYATLAVAIAHHPLAYAGHRLGHLNSTERWLVPAGWISAAPPAHSEPNHLGLGEPGRPGRGWQRLAEWFAETPLGWPIVWVVVALTGVAVLVRGPRSAAGELAIALFVSALALEASFAVISIASDLRYHLWAMIATALGVTLAAGEGTRRPMLVGVAVLALAITGGVGARLVLPTPPATYSGMLG